MLLSRGRTAYCGAAASAPAHFEALGHDVPPLTNVAEHLLDLVNADFADAASVDAVLDAWVQPALPGGPPVKGARAPPRPAQMGVMLRRQARLLRRDPVLFLVRAVALFSGNLYFAIVYVQARHRHQDQVQNRMMAALWLLVYPTEVSVLVAYATNAEMASVRTEVRNGLVDAGPYLFAKALLELPLMVILAVCAMGVPAFLILDFGNFWTSMLVWTLHQYACETTAAACACFRHPLVAMAAYMTVWYCDLLYCGIWVARKDIVWPLKAFYYVSPTTYGMRQLVWSDLSHGHYDECDNYNDDQYCFCGDDREKRCDGESVLRNLHKLFPLIHPKNTVAVDAAKLLAIAVAYKAAQVVLFHRSCRVAPLTTATKRA